MPGGIYGTHIDLIESTQMPLSEAKTYLFLVQTADGRIHTQRTMTEGQLGNGDPKTYLEAARTFYATFGAELISVTKVDEHHHVEVASSSQTLVHHKYDFFSWRELLTGRWWRNNAWAFMIVLMVANLGVGVYHFMADQSSTLYPLGGHQLLEEERNDGSTNRFPTQRRGPTGSP